MENFLPLSRKVIKLEFWQCTRNKLNFNLQQIYNFSVIVVEVTYTTYGKTIRPPFNFIVLDHCWWIWMLKCMAMYYFRITRPILTTTASSVMSYKEPTDSTVRLSCVIKSLLSVYFDRWVDCSTGVYPKNLLRFHLWTDIDHYIWTVVGFRKRIRFIVDGKFTERGHSFNQVLWNMSIIPIFSKLIHI